MEVGCPSRDAFMTEVFGAFSQIREQPDRRSLHSLARRLTAALPDREGMKRKSEVEYTSEQNVEVLVFRFPKIQIHAAFFKHIVDGTTVPTLQLRGVTLRDPSDAYEQTDEEYDSVFEPHYTTDSPSSSRLGELSMIE